MVNKKAFTLVELLIVILILGLVLLLVVPTVGKIGKDSRSSIRDNKIKTIEAGAEKYGNETINTFQKCTNSLVPLETECTVEISKLIEFGYIEPDNEPKPDEDLGIIDPNTNEFLKGKVLLCYDSTNISIHASYVEDGSYSCE